MLLTIVLIVLCLLEAGTFAVYILLNRRRNHRRNRIIADLADGIAEVDPIIPSDAAVRAVQGVLGRYTAMLDELEADLAESERASTRLSRNIQKSLIYAAEISTHSEENHETARTLRHDVTEGSSAVEEIMATIDSLSKQVMEQLRAVETTTEAMAEIDSALHNVFSIASERLKDTDALIQVTQQGRAKIEETDGVIRNVTEKVEDVSSLITVINTIASKTNLLAMNAAIEAAHAGDAGRGFAVVAEEIRNLASSTSDNAKTISVTLKELVDQINNAAASSRSSGEAFGKIDTGVGNVTDSFREINRLTSEISDRSGAVVESARALKEISGRTAESMEEMSIGSREIGKILSSSLTIADELDSSMAHLTDKARGINLISTKISSSYLRANRASEKLALTLERNRDGSSGMMQDRFSISNLILAHINWIAMARAVMDGTVESADIDLVDSRKCDLGRWLEEAATADVGDAAKLATLKSTHEELHECVGTLFQHVREGKTQDAARSYEKLLGFSARIVQILTTIGYDDFIKWDPSLTVGINTFDAHHQKLIRLINKLFVNMESGEGDDVLKRTLSELIDYTDWHFSAEEKAFEEFGYPERSDHVQQHKILLTKARELQKGLESGQSILTNEVLDFLQDWVMNHILKTDRKYTSHLHGRVD